MDKEKMIEWIGTHNVGTSSKTMWVALMCPQCVNSNDVWNYDTPRDAGDFSRCYDLYKFAKLNLNDLQMIDNKFPFWKPIIDEWHNLEYSYNGLDYCKVNNILSSKHDEIMKLKGFKKTSEFSWGKE